MSTPRGFVSFFILSITFEELETSTQLVVAIKLFNSYGIRIIFSTCYTIAKHFVILYSLYFLPCAY